MNPLATLVTLTGDDPGQTLGKAKRRFNLKKTMRKAGKLLRHNIAYATPYGPAVFAARVAQDKIKKARAKAAAKKAAKRKKDAETAAKRATALKAEKEKKAATAAENPKAPSLEQKQPEEEARPPEAPEAPAEEAPAEEAPEEEAPAEEAPAEEAPAEEAPAEEAAGIYGSAAAPGRALAIRPTAAPAQNAMSKITGYIKKNPAQVVIFSTTGIFLIFTIAKSLRKKRKK